MFTGCLPCIFQYHHANPTSELVVDCIDEQSEFDAHLDFDTSEKENVVKLCFLLTSWLVERKTYLKNLVLLMLFRNGLFRCDIVVIHLQWNSYQEFKAKQY